MVHAPIPEICGTIQEGAVPLVSVTTTTESNELILEHHSAVLYHTRSEPIYVAISHVWSDGMGNPRQNAMRSCQLLRVQGAVNDLYPSALTSNSNQPFWIGYSMCSASSRHSLDSNCPHGEDLLLRGQGTGPRQLALQQHSRCDRAERATGQNCGVRLEYEVMDVSWYE